MKIASAYLQLLFIAFVKSQNIPLSCLNAFRSSGLSAANSLRTSHSSPLLTTSSILQDSAQVYADKVAQTKSLVYSGSSTVGENIFDKKITKALTNDFCASIIIFFSILFRMPLIFFNINFKKEIANDCVTSWYSEYSKYNFNNPFNKPAYRDFTQLVWSSSTSVGFGLSSYTDASGNQIVNCIAHYSPKGNRERINLKIYTFYKHYQLEKRYSEHLKYRSLRK